MDNKPSLIIPVCGESSRYPGMRPKFLLTHPDGKPMLLKSIEGLKFDYNLYVITLKEHNDKYKYIGKIDELTKTRIKWIVLDEKTEGQAQTVASGIKIGNIQGQIIIKDCDNYFEIDKINPNGVAVYDLMQMDSVNARNKSYIRSSISGEITQIVEKDIVSNLFCCGLYSIQSAHHFVLAYENSKRNSYISDIISSLIYHHHRFKYKMVQNYLDWGTKEDWLKYCKQFSVLFIDIDGVLVENSAEYMIPSWGSTPPIFKNIQKINQLIDGGKTQVVLTTSRKSSYEKVTRTQLKNAGLHLSDDTPIIFNLQHGKRILINDYSDSNPYPSCDAINLIRNGDELEKLI